MVNRVLIFKILKSVDTIHRVVLTDKKTGKDVGSLFVEKGYAKYIFNKVPQYILEAKDSKKASTSQQPILHFTRPTHG